MSTRANIVIKTDGEKLFFYRHSDGYPEGVLPTLSIFMKWLKAGKIRNNAGQSAGWLILLGAMEYNTIPSFQTQEPFFKGGKRYGDTDTITDPQDWKCGSYEPTTGIHGDIEYLYVIDLDKQELQAFNDWTDGGEGKGDPINLNEAKIA